MGLRRTALLVDGHDPTLEIDPGLDGTQHLVAGTEYSREQPELLGQKLKHPLIGSDRCPELWLWVSFPPRCARLRLTGLNGSASKRSVCCTDG